MASLRNIMNVDVDDDHVDSHSLRDSGSTPSQHTDSSMVSAAYGRGSGYSLDASPSQSHGMHPSSGSLHSLPIGQHALSMPYNHLAVRNSSDRRQRNTSADSIDSHNGNGNRQGHGHAESLSNPAMMPYVPQQETPVKLTPITRRVSRAKKGVPVHTCDMCRPPKTFTRAEHLRRHQLSHQPPDLPCPVPGCDKVFHRRDLLERHQQRHDQDDRVVKPSGGAQARSPYNPGGRRKPSHVTSSPPASLMSMQQSYGKTSPTATGSNMSLGSAHWATQKSSPVHLHQGGVDMTMEGVKNEYLLDAASNGQTTTTGTVPDFSQPRSMPAIPTIDPAQTICASAAAVAPALTWPTAAVISAAPTQMTIFSSPEMAQTDDRRAALSLSAAGWSPFEQATSSQVLPSSIMAPNGGGFSVPFTYGPPLPSSYTSMYKEDHYVGYPGYDGHPALYGAHMPTTPAIRNLSPQFVLSESSETMITAPAPPAADRFLSTLSHRGEPGALAGIKSQHLMPVLPSREACSALPTYIDIYWDKVHPMYPIIHRATVEGCADGVPEQTHVLHCAMAAVATQFLGHREHRVNGSQLHLYAWHRSRAFTQSARWSLPVMQCVLLCEYYARFRGRQKNDYQPSSRFLDMYQMVSCHRSATMPKLVGTKSQRWAAWIYLESCRRLLSACFLLSVHGMCYYEQPYSTVLGVEKMTSSELDIPLSGSTMGLWEARNAEAWVAIDMSAIRLTTVGDVMQDESSFNIEGPTFDVSLVIAAHALRLPTRQKRQEAELTHEISNFRTNDLLMFRHFGSRPGATTYLALHYTPLHVLLAVSGDSWVFNKKMMSFELFAAHKRKLVQWRNSGTCAVATVFAARAIRDFLSLSDEAGQAAVHDVVAWKDISDYWGLYVCTLICWAFGHTGRRSGPERRLPARTRAIGWIQAAADMEPAQLQASPAYLREDTQAIVGFVRDILEKDCLAGRNILFTDSVGVLRKLEEVDNWSWF